MLALILGASTPTSAQAQQVPLWGPGYENLATHQDDLARWVAHNTARANTSIAPPVASQAYVEEWRPRPGAPSSAQLHDELYRLRHRSGLMPRLGQLMKSGGGFLLGSTAFMFGTKIGTGINAKWLGFNIPGKNSIGPAQTPWTAADLLRQQSVEKGELVYQLGGSTMVAPEDGFFIYNQSKQASNPYTQNVGSAQGANCTPAYPPLVPLVVAPFKPMVGQGVQCTIVVPDAPDPVVNVNGMTLFLTMGEFIDSMKNSGIGEATRLQPYVAQGVSSNPTTGLGITSGPQTVPEVVDAIKVETDGCRNPDYALLCDFMKWVSVDAADPVLSPFLVTVPSCAGITVAACETVMTSAGLELGGAVVTGPRNADLELPAGAVVRTEPAEGARVDSGTVIVPRTNPDPLPIALPAPAPGETAPAYETRLRALGYLGEITVSILSPEQLSTAHGPDVVVRTTPTTGTQVAVDEPITVRVNPSDAPVPGEGGAGACGPVPPALDFSPLMVELGDKFPFGVFGWIADTLGGWSGGGAIPVITIPMPGSIDDLVIDMGPVMDPLMDFIRPALLAISALMLGWMFASSAMGFGRGGSE